jgi:CRP-like cAMP-binding protein
MGEGLSVVIDGTRVSGLPPAVARTDGVEWINRRDRTEDPVPLRLRRPIVIPDVGRLSLFAGTGRFELERIRRQLTPVLVPAGYVLIERGAPATQFAIIADGEVSVTDGRGVEVAVLGPGAIVGELGLLRGVRTGATVTTLTPLVAYVGNRREFTAMLGASAAVDRRVVEVALDRVGAA